MTATENTYNIEGLLRHFEPPVLIVSTIVGRGAYRIGEAIEEKFSGQSQIYHIPIEHLLPHQAVNEDMERYRTISTRFPFLLYLIYKIPIFYYRKYLREKFFNTMQLDRLKEKIESLNIKTVICVSHRPAFWVSSLRRKTKKDFKIWGILVEYGSNLGWRYIFWEELAGFLSPIARDKIGCRLPPNVEFIKIDLPVKKDCSGLSTTKGDVNKVLLVCGFWGQGPVLKILKSLSIEMPYLKIYALCGTNDKLYEAAKQLFKNNANIEIYSTVESLAPFLKECASVITKPGMSTILETSAAHRKIFLLKGMPVAEDNNARFAMEHFDSEWFKIKRFKKWREGEM